MGHSDRWEKYRRRLGGAWKGQPGSLVDRRDWWASEERDHLLPQDLSRGEVRARTRFAYFLARGFLPHLAARRALCLDHGPIPELHSPAEFAQRWSRERLAAVAERWSKAK